MSPFRRLYSTTTSSAPRIATNTTRRRFYENFDKSMYYPIILTVIFGSQLINLMNIQRDYETLERKYQLKMIKIDEIINKINDKGVQKVDVEKELELVNKLFKNGYDTSAVVSKKSNKDSHSQDEELKEEDLLKMLGLNDTTTSIQQTATLKENKNPSKLSEMNVSEQIAFEKELQNFRVKAENHTIVEIPGDYVEAAKDTQVKRFL